jgi:hypothetical protein
MTVPILTSLLMPDIAADDVPLLSPPLQSPSGPADELIEENSCYWQKSRYPEAQSRLPICLGRIKTWRMPPCGGVSSVRVLSTGG